MLISQTFLLIYLLTVLQGSVKVNGGSCLDPQTQGTEIIFNKSFLKDYWGLLDTWTLTIWLILYDWPFRIGLVSCQSDCGKSSPPSAQDSLPTTVLICLPFPPCLPTLPQLLGNLHFVNKGQGFNSHYILLPFISLHTTDEWDNSIFFSLPDLPCLTWYLPFLHFAASCKIASFSRAALYRVYIPWFLMKD